jgi:hypothetical protein
VDFEETKDGIGFIILFPKRADLMAVATQMKDMLRAEETQNP